MSYPIYTNGSSTVNQAALGNLNGAYGGAAGNYGLQGGLGSYLNNSLGNYLQTGMSSGNWGKGNLIGAFGDKGVTYAGGHGSITGFDSGLGAAAGAIGGLLDKSAAHQRTSGKYGYVGQAADTVANVVGSVGNYNPLATGLGRLGMGAVNKITGGTDGMTVQDSLLGSSAIQGTLTGIAAATGPVGWGVAGAYLLASGINAATGKTTTDNAYKSFMDKDKLTDVASGYTDMDLENEAQNLYNKKYGGFSRGAYKKAQKKINQAQMRMTDKMAIRDEANLGLIRAGMVDANNMRYLMAINGGYKPLAIGREGLKITPERLKEAKRIAKCIKKKKSPIFNVIPAEAREAMRDVTKVPNDALPFFQKGGRPKLNSKETGEDPIGYLNDGTPLYAKGDGTIGPLTKENVGKDNLFDLIKNSNANWAKRLQDPNRKYITYPDGSIGNFKLAWSEDETGTIVYPEILEIDGLLIDLSEDRENAWKSAIEHKDYIYFPSNDAAEWFTKNYKNYYKGFNKSPLKFLEGGQMNVIPEGALHARKHHMEDDEHITKKGIPVVDINGKQQAEIERNEIIFRKEVTSKLEQLAKDGSDEAAIEAGKLLAKEIIENTDDRTGLIEQVTEKIPIGLDGFKFLGQTVNMKIPDKLERFDLPETESEKKAKNKQEFRSNLASGLIQGVLEGINTYVKGKAEKAQSDLQKKLADEEQLKKDIKKSNDFAKLNESFLNDQPVTVDSYGNVHNNRQNLTKEELAIMTGTKPMITENTDLKMTESLIKALNLLSTKDKKQLAQLNMNGSPAMAEEGTKLPNLLLEELIKLSPDKLQELKNILKYLNHD